MKKISLVVLTVMAMVMGTVFVNSALADGKNVDRTVKLYDQQGKPVLPDLAGKKYTQANELSFTFNSSVDFPWSEGELNTLQQWLSDFYPAIKKIYGPPAFNIEVNVEKNPYISYAGLYFSYSNTIVLPGLNRPDVFCHEMIHAFRDDLMISNMAYEEGMTRAAEVAIMSELPLYSYDNIHHSYSLDVMYELGNQPGIGAKNGNFYSGLNAFWRYQMAGMAWAKCLIESPDFFVKFNQSYYNQAYSNPDMAGDVNVLNALINKVKPRVENTKFDVWFSQQQIFNFNPPEGNQLVVKPDNWAVSVINRDSAGTEHFLPNTPVSWEIFDCNGAVLSQGEGSTGQFGWIELPWLFTEYRGLIRIELSANVDGEDIFFTFLTSNIYPQGISGIVTEGVDGTAKIKTLDSSPIVNSTFTESDLQDAGKYNVVCRGDGYSVRRCFTKDAAPYFVLCQ